MLYNKINNYFTSRHFQSIPTDRDNVRMFVTYEKSYLYLINIVNLESKETLDIKRYEEYKAVTKLQFAEYTADKTILLTIVLTDSPDKLYSYIDFEPNVLEEFVDVIWMIDKENRALIIPQNQLAQVINLEKELAALIKEEYVEKRIKLKVKHQVPYYTYGLVALNIMLWTAMELSGGSYNTEVLLRFGAMYTPYIIEQGEFFRLFTAVFLHAGFSHLFMNCFGIILFGGRVERLLSIPKFLMIYMGSALIGSAASLAAQLIFEKNSISVGASGAVYGMIGSIIVLSRLSGREIQGLSDYSMAIFFVIGMAASVAMPGIDVFAHLGGFIGGIIVTYFVARSKREDNHETGKN